MRKVRVKALKEELKSMLGDNIMTKRMWRHHKRAYIRG